MTEAALDSGGVSAPAEPTGAPLPETGIDVPNALGSQTPVPEKPAEPEQPKSTREALRSAMDAVKAKEAAKVEDNGAKPAEPKDPKAVEPKPDAKLKEPAQPALKPAERAADGKFAPKPADPQPQPQPQPQPLPAAQQQPLNQEPGRQPGMHDAPARFDAAAKAEWANAPESIKGAVHRTIRELETGIEEHQRRWEPIKQYDDLARQYQTDLPSALERYVSMDKLLSQDLATGLDSIIRDKTGGQAGLREFVAQLTGQQPDQASAQNDRTMHDLRQEIAGLKQQLSGVTGHIQQQAATSINERVSSFASDKPDFEALSSKIAEHIGKGLGLEAAYDAAKQEAEELARSLGFVPAQVSQPLSPAPLAPPLKPAGQKSISGAPATGSDPASQKKAPASSIREALERAKARVG